jgi:hypothetical protein
MIRDAIAFAQLTLLSIVGGMASEGYERLSSSAVYVLAQVVSVVGLIVFIGYAVANIRPVPRGRRHR